LSDSTRANPLAFDGRLDTDLEETRPADMDALSELLHDSEQLQSVTDGELSVEIVPTPLPSRICLLDLE
jgi:hypothetical protein